MNISNLNRNVLAFVVGSVLAAGVAAPANAQSWRQRHAAQDQAATTQDSEDAREARRKEREERDSAAKARQEAATQRETSRQREQSQRDSAREQQQQRESAQRDRELAGMREQQERIREQNRQTRERNEQASGREQARDQREQARAGERAQRDQRRDEVAQVRERQQQDRQADRQDRQSDRQERQQDRQEQRQENRHADLPAPRRLENRERDQRIVREKRQAQTYQQAIKTTIAPQAKSYANTLYHQHRSHGYNYQQQYYWRLLQMLTAWSWNSYNYYNDPYFYTANDYRYYRGGSWYGINRYGADILRQAINYGYQEGFYAGRADHLDGWRYDYRGAWVYRDANYGYRGFYVSQGEYNYYFRQGFRRGYEDGYYQRYRYGRSYNGSEVILGTVLSGILNLQAYRW